MKAAAVALLGTVAVMVVVAAIDILVFEEKADPRYTRWTDKNRWER